MASDWTFKAQSDWYDLLLWMEKTHPKSFPYIREQLIRMWDWKSKEWYYYGGGSRVIKEFVGSKYGDTRRITFKGLTKRRKKSNKGRMRH